MSKMGAILPYSKPTRTKEIPLAEGAREHKVYSFGKGKHFIILTKNIANY